MQGREHADMDGIYRNPRTERRLDIATAVIIGVLLALGLYCGWSA